MSASKTGSEAVTSLTPKAGKKPEDHSNSLRFLADRAAILLVIAKMRYGNDWNPFFRDALFDDEGSLGDEIRSWPEYKSAMLVIRNWLRRHRAAESDATDAA